MLSMFVGPFHCKHQFEAIRGKAASTSGRVKRLGWFGDKVALAVFEKLEDGNAKLLLRECPYNRNSVCIVVL